MLNLRAVFTVICSVVLMTLSGCSSDSGNPASAPLPAPDPLAAYKSQVVDWQACDPGILGAGFNLLMQDAQADLGDRLKCAMIRVPLDYDNPGKGDLKIAITRTAAQRTAERSGAIFFNPGGPGVDGLYFPVLYGFLWSKVNPQDEIGAALATLANRYDLIGFSPRGTGASTQLVSGSNEQLKQTSFYDRSEQNVRAQLYNAELIAKTSLKNPLTPYINTEQTVRDMDLIRHLLGDEKLHYIGYSYGTWLGTWYASRFPQHTGRMLLDSSMNVAGTFDDALLMDASGRQRLLDDYMAPYAARKHAQFSLGATAEEVRQLFPALATVRLKELLLKKIAFSAPEQSAAQIDRNLYWLRAAQVLDGIVQTHPGADDAAILNVIATTRFLPDEADNQIAQASAQELYHGLSAPPAQQNILLLPSDAVFNAVVCNDTPSNASLDFWILMGNRQLADYPLYGGKVTQHPCLYWGGPTVQKPPISAVDTVTEGPLMLQSRFDAMTPIEGAMNGFARLGKARMVVVEYEYRHGLFPYSTPCVDLTVADYFLNGRLPQERLSFCDGTDDVRAIVQPAAVASKAALSHQQQLSRTYRDPEKAAEIIRSIREQIR